MPKLRHEQRKFAFLDFSASMQGPGFDRGVAMLRDLTNRGYEPWGANERAFRISWMMLDDPRSLRRLIDGALIGRCILDVIGDNECILLTDAYIDLRAEDAQHLTIIDVYEEERRRGEEERRREQQLNIEHSIAAFQVRRTRLTYMQEEEMRRARLTHLQEFALRLAERFPIDNYWQTSFAFKMPCGLYPHLAKGFSKVPEDNVSNEASDVRAQNYGDYYEGLQIR